jgi:predicted transcriptional regulator
MESSLNLNPSNPGLRQVLGDLEAEIMECLWDMGSATVRDVYECLLGRRDIAYTTVMTVMSRLAEKGMLARAQDGRAYVYTPVQSRDAFCTSVVKRVMAGLFGSSGRPVLAHFVENLTQEDQADLDVLADLIEKKRREGLPSSSSLSA